MSNEVSGRITKWPNAVKAKRRYDSPRRREQAAATRREILDAAQRLFERAGLRGDDDGGDRRRGGRRAQDRLRRLRDQERRAARALAPAACAATRTTPRSAERDWYREVLEEPDPERQLRLNARNSRVGQAAHRAAHRGHPQRGPRRPRHRGALEPHPDRLLRQPARDRGAPDASAGAAPRPRRRPRAADILWTLNHPDLWQLLVVERGWTPDRFEKWFADTAFAQLLR